MMWIMIMYAVVSMGNRLVLVNATIQVILTQMIMINTKILFMLQYNAKIIKF